MTVTTSANYLLRERVTGAETMNKTLMLPYTAPFSSAFIAVERLRVANKGFIKTNLEQLLRELAALKRSP